MTRQVRGAQRQRGAPHPAVCACGHHFVMHTETGCGIGHVRENGALTDGPCTCTTPRSTIEHSYNEKLKADGQ